MGNGEKLHADTLLLPTLVAHSYRFLSSLPLIAPSYRSILSLPLTDLKRVQEVDGRGVQRGQQAHLLRHLPLEARILRAFLSLHTLRLSAPVIARAARRVV